MVKSLWASKTFWVAVLQASVGVVAAFASAYPEIGTILILKSIADVLLRIATTQPVAV